ncbi:MAG TPA: site-2 protease family protein [Byssovorax sp.]|jgi:Zn-dependent protease
MLRFALLGFDVEVRPLFWVTALLLGFGFLDHGPAYFLLLWVAVVFASILLHEVGHGLAFRHFGVRAHLALHGMGGHAQPEGDVPLTRAQRVIVSFAGPVAGFCPPLFAWLFGLLLPGVRAGLPMPLGFAIDRAAEIGVAWGLFNLLPVLPLDGGHVLEDVLGPRRSRLTAFISSVVALAVGVWALASGAFVAAYFMGMSLVETNRRWVRERLDGMRTARRAAVRARAHEKRRTAEVATARTVDGLADQDADAPPPMPPEIEGVLGRILDEVDAEQRAKRSRR